MSEYKYICPTEKGYKKFKLTKRQHKEMFPNLFIDWRDKYKYYYNDREVIVEKTVSILGLLVLTVFLPILVVFHGLFSVKEIFQDYLKDLNQKKYNRHICEIYSLIKYERLMEKLKPILKDK